MSKWERSFTSFFAGVAQNVTANIVVILIPILIGVLFTLYNNNPQIVLVWVLIVLVALNSFATIFVLRGQRAISKQRPQGVIFRDIQNESLYLMDIYGRMREVPDKDTSSFLEHALGVLDDIPELPSREIVRLRGEKLPSIKDWKRPLTPEEQAKKELSRRLSRVLTVESNFDEDSRPQKMDVKIISYAEKLVYISKVRFQPHSLPETAFPTSYPKEGTYTLIPFDKSAANIASGNALVLQLQFRQVWQRSDIEQIKGRLGFLIIDAVYEGKSADSILFQL
jgi:hypothetical protein